jgi:hypothetical protein
LFAFHSSIFDNKSIAWGFACGYIFFKSFFIFTGKFSKYFFAFAHPKTSSFFGVPKTSKIKSS